MKGIAPFIIAVIVGVALGLLILSMMISSGSDTAYPAPVKHPPAVYTQSVQIAHDYWTSRHEHNVCNNVQLILIDSIPSFYDQAVGQALIGKCTMLIQRAWFMRNIRDKPKICTLVIHEVGHLNGKRHVKNVYNIMFPALVYAPKECTRL